MLSPKDYSKFEYDGSAMEGRYLHLQLTPEEWRTLEQSGDIPPDPRMLLAGLDPRPLVGKLRVLLSLMQPFMEQVAQRGAV